MNHCTLSQGFSILEKLYAQVSFFAMIITGTIGVYMSAPLFAIPYVLVSWFGIPGIIQRHIVCPRCPHLHRYGDCLQLSPRLTRLLVKKPKHPKFALWEKGVFLFIFLSIPIYPLYWLLEYKLLLLSFIFFSSCWYGGQFFYFCKRCRVSGCPFNRAKMLNAENADALST